MSAYAVPASPATWGQSPWQRWAAEVADAGGWAARTLAQALAVALAWPLRLAVRALAQVHWGSGETIMSTAVLGLPTVALIAWFPRVHWPTLAEALADLQQVGGVLTLAFLALTSGRVLHGSGGRSCCAGGHRHLVPSPDGTKTWRWIVAMHEAGHLVVGKKLRRRTGKAKIAGGGGVTIVHPNHRDIVGEIAIDMAGGIAAETQVGCEGDQANARARLRRFVRPERHGEVMAAGTRKAHALVAAHRGEILAAARKIYDRGWTR